VKEAGGLSSLVAVIVAPTYGGNVLARKTVAQVTVRHTGHCWTMEDVVHH
jgi:hypothetical protein